MKKQPILLIGFTRYTDKGLPAKVSVIINNMTGNLLYADAGTLLTDVQDAIEKFLAAVGKRGKELNYFTEKEGKRNILNAALRALGTYVSDKYPGNVDNWLTSGFSVQTWEINTQKPETPLIKKAADGELTGEVLVTTNRPQYTRIFEGRYAEQGSTPPDAASAVSSKSRILFQGLTPGKTYSLQIRARGTKGASNWSNPVIYIVR